MTRPANAAATTPPKEQVTGTRQARPKTTVASLDREYRQAREVSLQRRNPEATAERERANWMLAAADMVLQIAQLNGNPGPELPLEGAREYLAVVQQELARLNDLFTPEAKVMQARYRNLQRGAAELVARLTAEAG